MDIDPSNSFQCDLSSNFSNFFDLPVSSSICAGPFTVALSDAQKSAHSSSLAGTGMSFYSDAACGTSISSLSIAAQSTQANFYLISTQGGLSTVQAQIAYGSPNTVSYSFTTNDIQALAVKVSHACALHASGLVYCWGLNSSGQLGNNSMIDSYSPVLAQGLTDVTSITASSSFSCALTTSGNVYCWGSNSWGELGINYAMLSNAPLPSLVVDSSGFGYLSQVSSFSSGNGQMCATNSSNNIYCWGFNNNGQVGNGTTGFYNYYPIQTLGLSGSGYLAAKSVTGGFAILSVPFSRIKELLAGDSMTTVSGGPETREIAPCHSRLPAYFNPTATAAINSKPEILR